MINQIYFFLFWLLSFNQLATASNPGKVANLSHFSDWNTCFYALLDSSRAVENRDITKSLYFTDQAKAYADSLDQETLFVKVFNQYGRIYFKNGLLAISSEYYLKSHEIIKTAKDIPTSDLLGAFLGLGINYLAIGNYDKAEEYILDSQNLLETLPQPDYMTLSAITNNLGIIYRERGELVLAYSILTNGIKTIGKLDPGNQNISLLYNNLGRVHTLMNNYEAALEAFNYAQEDALMKNNVLGLVTNYSSIAETYWKMGRLPQAIRYARRGYQAAAQGEILVVQQNCSELLANLYKELPLADSSLFYLEAKESLIRQINIHKAEQNLMAQNLRELHALEKQHLIKKSKNIYLKLFLIFLPFLMVSAILLNLYNALREKYKSFSLERIELEHSIQQKENEKELLKANIHEKNKALTAKLLHETKRLQIIKDTVDKLIGHRNEFSRQGREIVSSVVRDLRQFDQDHILSEFETSFLDLHTDFYINLLNAFPDLTQNERRLCAFIRLNLNSREISALTGQSSPTLNMAKTRLRKKFGITNSDMEIYDVVAKF